MAASPPAPPGRSDRDLRSHLSRKERISFRNYGLRRAALNELTFFSLCIFVRYRSATPFLLTGSVLERLSITETRASLAREVARFRCPARDISFIPKML